MCLVLVLVLANKLPSFLSWGLSEFTKITLIGTAKVTRHFDYYFPLIQSLPVTFNTSPCHRYALLDEHIVHCDSDACTDQVQKWLTVMELMNASSKSDGSDLSVFAVCTICGEIGQNRNVKAVWSHWCDGHQ